MEHIWNIYGIYMEYIWNTITQMTEQRHRSLSEGWKKQLNEIC